MRLELRKLYKTCEVKSAELQDRARNYVPGNDVRRSTRVSSPGITLKWPLKSLFAKSRSRSNSSSVVRDPA
jgi:hypothetical protein